MVDRLTPAERSWNMSRIRSADTAPEKTVRSLLHRRGFRFRLHPGKLPGKPDIVLPKHRAVAFVHGCFWHRHDGCRYTTMPATRSDWWLAKFSRNVARDRDVRTALETHPTSVEAASAVVAWWRTLGRQRGGVLNVAGSRESQVPGIQDRVQDILGLVLEAVDRTPRPEHRGRIVIMGGFVGDSAGGEFALKRFGETASEWVFTSDNPAYAPIRIAKAEVPAYPILGLAVYDLTRGARLATDA